MAFHEGIVIRWSRGRNDLRPTIGSFFLFGQISHICFWGIGLLTERRSEIPETGVNASRISQPKPLGALLAASLFPRTLTLSLSARLPYELVTATAYGACHANWNIHLASVACAATCIIPPSPPIYQHALEPDEMSLTSKRGNQDIRHGSSELRQIT